MTYDETKAVATSDLQYRACQPRNRQFCRINAVFQPLANLPSCVTALYAKNDKTVKEQCSLVISHMPCTFVHVAVTSNLWIIPSNPQPLRPTMTIICPDKATSTVHLQQPFHIWRLSPACSAISRYFHLALQKLANILEVPVAKLYRGMINNSEPIHSFTIEDNKDPSLIWTILKHPGTYIGTISMIFVLCKGVYCLKFWIRPASPGCWPYSHLFVTCHSGWWCRGSTHLQAERQGWKADMTPQES